MDEWAGVFIVALLLGGLALGLLANRLAGELVAAAAFVLIPVWLVGALVRAIRATWRELTRL